MSLLGDRVSLLAWGWRGEIGTPRAEVRASIAEASAEYCSQVNGTFTKRDLCKTITGGLAECNDKLEGLPCSNTPTVPASLASFPVAFRK